MSSNFIHNTLWFFCCTRKFHNSSPFFSSTANNCLFRVHTRILPKIYYFSPSNPNKFVICIFPPALWFLFGLFPHLSFDCGNFPFLAFSQCRNWGIPVVRSFGHTSYRLHTGVVNYRCPIRHENSLPIEQLPNKIPTSIRNPFVKSIQKKPARPACEQAEECFLHDGVSPWFLVFFGMTTRRMFHWNPCLDFFSSRGNIQRFESSWQFISNRLWVFVLGIRPLSESGVTT